MKKLILLVSFLLLTSCDYLSEIEQKAAVINGYEKSALALSKENRDLKVVIKQLEYEIQSLKSKNNYLTVQLEKDKKGRQIASIPAVSPENDMVKFDVYKWTPSQMVAIAHKEFADKNYEKSAQFFKSCRANFPTDKRIDDEFLFQAGVAAYESGKHHEWVFDNLSKLVTDYPASKYYRGAKLWMALTNLKLGKNQEFFQTVEEFRKKYRNTSEWKILSAHYEEILQKYKN